MIVNKYFSELCSAALSAQEQDLFQFYPDVIPYKYQYKDNYLYDWNLLITKAKTHSLYVDNHSIKPIGRLRKLWESVKGKLGFTNHCAQERIQLAMQKFAYYGYIKNYLNLPLGQHVHQILSSDFVTALNREDEDNNILNLQVLLKNSYITKAKKIQPSYWTRKFSTLRGSFPSPRNNTYRFGDSIMYALRLSLSCEIDTLSNKEKVILNTLKILATIQPQDLRSIMLQFAKYDTLKVELLKKGCGNNPKLTSCFVQHFMDQANVVLQSNVSRFSIYNPKQNWDEWYHFAQKALYLQPSIAGVYSQHFITYYLYVKDFNKAIALIENLSEAEQLKWIFNQDYEKSLVNCVKKDSQLGKRLAKEYIQKAHALFSMNTDSFMAKADKLASWAVDPSRFFDFYVKQSRFDEAYQIFTKANTDVKLSAHSLELLAAKYHQKGEDFYNMGNAVRNKNHATASVYYKQSLKTKKIAYALEPANKHYQQNVQIHRRLNAQLLADTPLQSGQSRAHILDKAIQKFRKCHAAKSNDEFLKPAYFKVLEERINMLIKECLINDYRYHIHAPEDHKIKCKDTVFHLVKYLEEVIAILDPKIDRLSLAKFHFILGDLRLFFELPNYAQHFEKANQYQPKNPFYKAALSDVRNNISSDQLLDLFDGYEINATRYYDWKEERWCMNKHKSSDLNIHDATFESKGFFNIF